MSDPERQRVVWLSRYRTCVAVDNCNSDSSVRGFAEFARERSDRRWRAIEGLAAAHVALEPNEPESSLASDLSPEAYAWLAGCQYDRLFQRK